VPFEVNQARERLVRPEKICTRSVICSAMNVPCDVGEPECVYLSRKKLLVECSPSRIHNKVTPSHVTSSVVDKYAGTQRKPHTLYD
jgi:hypothetical protein